MDLSAIDVTAQSNQGIEVELYHPATRQPLTDDDTGEKATITILGRYSDIYLKTQRKYQNRRLSQRSGRIKITAEELEAETIEILANCITAWKHITEGDQSLECNYKNAKHVLNAYPWLREQLEEAISDDSNFTNKQPQ